jgi:hypothetical protein
VFAQAALAIGDDAAGLIDLVRPVQALYIGGMGARGANFYNNLAVRYGYGKEAAEIQDAYLAGRKKEAEALIPQDLLEHVSLIGPKSFVAERIAAMEESGVTTLTVAPLGHTHAERVALIEAVKDLAG